MSFISKSDGRSHNAGFFLESEVDVVRKTKTIKADMGVVVGDKKIVPAGTAWPADDETAEGIVYEDVDVTTGDMPGSVVIEGRVYADRVSDTVTTSKTTLAGKGITFIEKVPEIKRGEE